MSLICIDANEARAPLVCERRPLLAWTSSRKLPPSIEVPRSDQQGLRAESSLSASTGKRMNEAGRSGTGGCSRPHSPTLGGLPRRVETSKIVGVAGVTVLKYVKEGTE